MWKHLSKIVVVISIAAMCFSASSPNKSWQAAMDCIDGCCQELHSLFSARPWRSCHMVVGAQGFLGKASRTQRVLTAVLRS